MTRSLCWLAVVNLVWMVSSPVLWAVEGREALAVAKTDYEAGLTAIEFAKSQRLEVATAAYLQHLQTLFDRCLDERQLETASAVKTEMDRVRERAPVTEADLKRGLVLHFTFDKAEPAGRVVDQSGQGNDGRAVGAHWTASGRRGGGFSFGPVDNYIRVPNHDSLNPRQITLAAWIRTERRDKYWRRIIDKMQDQGFAFTIVGDFPGKSWQGQFFWRIKDRWMFSGLPVADGRWHHVAATYNGLEQRLYLDGVPAGSPLPRPDLTELPRNQYDLTIGLDRADPNDVGTDHGRASFDGTMDEVMMFEWALSAKEIRKLYEIQAAAPVPATPTKAGAAPGAQAADRLKAAKELYDQGLMPKDEYEKKVKEIINEL
jgi:hypothetical protein